MNNKKKFDLKLYLDILHNKKNLKTVKRNGFIYQNILIRLFMSIMVLRLKKLKSQIIW